MTLLSILVVVLVLSFYIKSVYSTDNIKISKGKIKEKENSEVLKVISWKSESVNNYYQHPVKYDNINVLNTNNELNTIDTELDTESNFNRKLKFNNVEKLNYLYYFIIEKSKILNIDFLNIKVKGKDCLISFEMPGRSKYESIITYEEYLNNPLYVYNYLESIKMVYIICKEEERIQKSLETEFNGIRVSIHTTNKTVTAYYKSKFYTLFNFLETSNKLSKKELIDLFNKLLKKVVFKTIKSDIKCSITGDILTKEDLLLAKWCVDCNTVISEDALIYNSNKCTTCNSSINLIEIPKEKI